METGQALKNTRSKQQNISEQLLNGYNKLTVQEAIKDFGVDVKDKDGNYRCMYDVLKNISDKCGNEQND